ncbi:B3 domain-containing protein Os07g0563300 [Eucalyptus grandis]|uniref:B3 domain-containing protein Os07g0563300 n=1 Tax=Eucalyptus grandis TaxID=71139 RepID=UPI00192ED0EE|nr:B3 domain-containing protein Os07g0563300 [Eucalyptus grandis]
MAKIYERKVRYELFKISKKWVAFSLSLSLYLYLAGGIRRRSAAARICRGNAIRGSLSPASCASESSCSADQDLTAEELEDMPPDDNPAPYKKAKAPKQENMEALEGLHTLANLAILGEGEVLPSSSSSSQATTKHPRHRPGCSCIVCIQPPVERAQNTSNMHM